MRTILFILICFSLSCNGLREGAMSIIESKVVHAETDLPLKNLPVKIQKCEVTLSIGSFCKEIETVFTDDNGMIKYAVFHDDNENGHYFEFTIGYQIDSLCTKFIELRNGDLYDDLIKLNPC